MNLEATRFQREIFGVCEVIPNGVADDLEFGGEPRDAGMEAMRFEAQESTQGQANVIALCACAPQLATFDPAKLLDAAMVLFNRVAILRVLQTLQFIHRQVVAWPIFQVAVWSDSLEHFDEAIPFEMNGLSLIGDIN